MNYRKDKVSLYRNKPMHKLFSLFFSICFFIYSCTNEDGQDIDKKGDISSKRIKVGAYYFGGWAGINALSETEGELDWAKDAPSHLTRSLFYKFSDRKPKWGWRDDSLEIMEEQIKLAADNGIDFFMFCWYWSNDKGSINRDRIENSSLHTCIDLYMRAKNKHRIKFGILIANHEGAEIIGDENWEEVITYLSKYFKDKQYITIDGKPYVSIFNAEGLEQRERDIMQKAGRNAGIDSLSIVACGSTSKSKKYQYRTHYNAIPIGDNEGKPELDYDYLVKTTEREWVVTNQPYIPTVSVGWDPRPWYERKYNDTILKGTWYYVNNTPEKFKKSLYRAAEWIENHPHATVEEKIVMIYAWNELAEGGYLVPNASNNYGEHLKMIKEVVFSDKK